MHRTFDWVFISSFRRCRAFFKMQNICTDRSVATVVAQSSQQEYSVPNCWCCSSKYHVQILRCTCCGGVPHSMWFWTPIQRNAQRRLYLMGQTVHESVRVVVHIFGSYRPMSFAFGFEYFMWSIRCSRVITNINVCDHVARADIRARGIIERSSSVAACIDQRLVFEAVHKKRAEHL